MKRTERTLAEQIKLNRMEFEARKELLDFTPEDVYNLKKVGPRIESIIDLLVEEFYEQQTAIDDVALIIGDADTLERLRSAQKQYIIDLFSGYYDMTYANNRLRIGLVHKRIGVGPKFYLSAMQLLKSLLFKAIYEVFADYDEAKSIIASLEKLLMLDIQLVFDAYIRSLVNEVETSKIKVEDYAENLEEEVAQRTRELEELSQQDPLTNLYNRRAMIPTVNRDLANAKRQSVPVSMVYIDLDKFKSLNDNFGHAAGDKVLETIGGLLLNVTRAGDFPCRMGGDEFSIFLMGSDGEDAIAFAQRVLDEFTIGEEMETSLSIGVCTTGPKEFITAHQLIQNADTAMYEAKKTPGNKIVSFSELSEAKFEYSSKSDEMAKINVVK